MNIIIDNKVFPQDCNMSSDGTAWAMDYKIGAPIYEKVYVSNPGVAGLLIKRGNYRKRPITIATQWFGLDKDQLLLNIEEFVDTISNKAFNVKIGTRQFYQCDLVNEDTNWSVPLPVISTLQDDSSYLCSLITSFISKADTDISN